MIQEPDTQTIKLIGDLEGMDPFMVSLKLKNIDQEKRRFISTQIASRKKARQKIPAWAENNRIIFPGKLGLEQASSSVTASYKNTLVQGNRMLDLTGGLGVDTWFFSKKFKTVEYIEKDPILSDIASYNFGILKSHNIKVYNTSAEVFIENLEETYDWIYIDPSRRIDDKKIFRLEDSEPDVIGLLPELRRHADHIMIKASPFLDLKYILDIINSVVELHIVAVENECREIIIVLNRMQVEPKLYTVNFSGTTSQKYSGTFSKESAIEIKYGISGKYLYDPNAAIRKSGLLKSISIDFNLLKLASNSHLYTSEERIMNFPGRVFLILDILPFHHFIKENRIKKGNIAIRNFNMSVDKVKLKTRISDGGEIYFFFSSDESKNKIVIIAQKV